MTLFVLFTALCLIRPVRQALQLAVVVYVAALVPLAVDWFVHLGVLT